MKENEVPVETDIRYPDMDVYNDQPMMREAARGGGAATSETPDGTCPGCGATFSGYPGMRNHMRRAHPQEFHSAAVSHLESSRNWLWTKEEERIMANFELAQDNMRNINIKIQKTLFPMKTINQISCHRKTQPYRRLLQIVRETGGPIPAGGGGGSDGCCGLGSPWTAAAAAASARAGGAGLLSPLATSWTVAESIPASTARVDKTGDQKWTKEESMEMARFEAQSSPRINQKIREINLLPGRTLFSIKGH